MDDVIPAPTPKTDHYKIAVVLREDLLPWQRLNVTSFLVSGIAAAPGVLGLAYRDASGNSYLPMFREPVMAFGASLDGLRAIAERARIRVIEFSVFTDELFATYNDHDNRQAVAEFTADALNLAGIAFRCPRNVADKLLKGYKLLN